MTINVGLLYPVSVLVQWREKLKVEKSGCKRVSFFEDNVCWVTIDVGFLYPVSGNSSGPSSMIINKHHSLSNQLISLGLNLELYIVNKVWLFFLFNQNRQF